jgi:hypothetical protein
MASQDLSVVLRYLPDKYKKAYAKGALSDDDLVEWGRASGVLEAPKAAPPAPAPEAPKEEPYTGHYPGLYSPVAKTLDTLDSVQDLGGDVANAIKGGAKQFIGSKQYTAADTGEPALAQLTQGVTDMFDMQNGGLVGSTLRNMQDPSRMSLDSIKQRGGDLYTQGSQQVEDATRSAVTRAPGSAVGKVATGIAAMPSALLGVAGGPTSAIPSADYFTQEYTKSRLAGLDHAQALKEASTKAAAMEAVAVIPAGSVLGRIPAVKKVLADDLMGTAARAVLGTGSTMAGEGVKMDAITGSQLAIDKMFSLYSGDKKTQDYSTSNLPDNALGVWNELKDSFLMGSAMGVTRAPSEYMHSAAKAGQLAGQALEGQRSSEQDLAKERGKKPRILDNGEPNPDHSQMFDTPEGLPTYEQYQEQQRHANELDALDSVGRKQDLANKRDHIDRVLGLDVTSAQHAQDGGAIADAARRAGLTDQLAALPRAPGEPVPAPKPLGEQQSLPLNEPLQPADSAALKQQLATKRAHDEAAALIEEDNKGIQDKAKSNRQAARRVFLRTATEQSREIANPDERRQYVVDAATKWEAENPLDKFLADANKARTRTKVKAPVITKAAEPVVKATVGDENSLSNEEPIRPEEGLKTLDQLKGELGLANKTSADDTGVRTPHVLKAIGESIHKGASKVAAKLIADKNLMIVDDASHIPADAVPSGTGGYYDGKRTYVVANTLDSKNIMGDLLNMTAHEVKHGNDFAAADSTKRNLGHIIGDAANKRIGTKIEDLARVDSASHAIGFDKLGSDLTPEQEKTLTPAQKAVHFARQGSDANTYSLELPAYFINTARGVRDAKSSAGQLRDNVVSAVRNAAKRKFGNKTDVNLKDVAYLSDKLLKETAASGERLATPDGTLDKTLPMIVGKKSRYFDSAKRDGRVYTSEDGHDKFVASDSRSSLTPKSIDVLSDLITNPNKTVPLESILSHADLKAHYPDLKIKVSVDPAMPENSGASYIDGHIRLSERTAELGISDPSDLHDALIHELQHAVQDHEGHSRGSNPEMFLTKDDHAIVAKHKAAVEDLNHLTEMSKVHTDALTHSTDDIRAIRELGTKLADRSLTRIEYLEGVADVLSKGDGTTRSGQNVISGIKRGTESVKNLGAEVNRRYATADNKYMETYGELEARFSEDNRRKTQDQLPINPENPRTQEAGMGLDMPAKDAHIVTHEGAVRLKEPPELTKGEGLAFNAKQFREASKSFANPENKAIRLLKSMFLYSGNLGTELNEMREDSTGEAALYSHRAMNALARINTAVSQMAEAGMKRGVYKSHDVGVEAFKKQINDKLESIAKLEDTARREAALSAWVRDNPAMRPVMDAVNEINQLSRTLLIQLVKTHPDPTPDQLRLMNTLHANSFRYATRMYAAFQGDAGRAHSSKLVKGYEAGQKALTNGHDVPAKFREDFNVLNNAMKYLIDNDLRIPDEEGLQSASTEKLNNLFTTWVGDASETRQRVRAQAIADGATHAEADQMVRETMAAALNDRAQHVDQKDMEGKSMDIIKGMLDLNPSDSPFATFYRGFAQDRSILEHRERLPQEIKDLFGEIKDPATRLAVTIAKQGELAARTRLLLDMRDQGDGKWLIKGHEAGLPGNEKFTVPLKGESYGPLRDYRTTPAIADAIGKNLEMYSTMTQAIAKSYNNTQATVDAFARAGARGITSLAGKQKLLSVVFDLYNIGQNFIGSPVGLIANGVVNPKYYLSGLKTGGEVIMDTAFDNQNKLSKDYEDAIRHGVLDSARVQEIRATPQRTIKGMISDEAKAVRQGKSVARRASRTVVETFAMSDAWIKVGAFKERTDLLTKFYKAEGITKTPEEIKRIAANTIKDTTITYSRVPPSIKVLEAVGATTFMPYFYSVPRSISHNYIRGVKDLIEAAHAKSSEGQLMMAMSGAQRITGATAATYGFTMLLKGIAAAANGDDKDKADEMKKLMSEDARFSDSIYVGRDKTNTPLFVRLSRIDPFGPTNDIMRVYLNDKLTPEEKSRFALKLFGNLFFSNRITQAVVKEGAAFAGVDVKDKKTKIERFAPTAAEKAKDFLLNIGHMNLTEANTSLEAIDSLVPGIMDAFDPTNATPTTVKDNDPATRFLTDMILASGGRLDRADPGLAAYAAGAELKTARDDGRKRMKDGFSAGSDPQDMVTRFKDAATAEYLAIRHASTVYEGMTRGLDYTPRQASEVLKENGSLTPVDINSIRTGRVSPEADSWVNQYSQILSKQSLTQRSKTDERRMTPDEVKQNHKNIQDFLKIMKALGVKVNNTHTKD